MVNTFYILIHLLPILQSEQSRIEQTYMAFVEAFKRQDLEAVLFYVDHNNSSTMLLGTQLLHGEEIKQYYKTTLSNLAQVERLDISDINISILSASSAILHCNFHEWLTTSDGDQHYYEGAAMYYFEKRRNHWKIIHSSGAVKCS